MTKYMFKCRTCNTLMSIETDLTQDKIHMKRMWLDAEEKSESWERRYYNLIEDISAEEESKVGS